MPVESVHIGQWALTGSGILHRITQISAIVYRAPVIGLRHADCNETLWLADHWQVLAVMRPRSLGGQRNWKGSPPTTLTKSRQLRQSMTWPERVLWQTLRNKAIGFKFRRQHPIGPYIADFYSRDAALVIEIDGAEAHGSDDARLYDHQRDDYMRSLGLGVLRVSARDVMHDISGTYDLVRRTCMQRTSAARAHWCAASDLVLGDLVFRTQRAQGIPLVQIVQKQADTMIWTIQVEEGCSVVTQMCIVRCTLTEP
jgi:adenine-specific DNA-methyltransferase